MAKLPPLVVASNVDLIGVNGPDGTQTIVIKIRLTVSDNPMQGQERELEEIVIQVPNAVQLAQELQRNAIRAGLVGGAMNASKP